MVFLRFLRSRQLQLVSKIGLEAVLSQLEANLSQLEAVMGATWLDDTLDQPVIDAKWPDDTLDQPVIGAEVAG